jgi:hypothetical protein
MFHPFPLPDAASPPFDVTMPSRCVTLSSHGAKTSSLPSLHLSTTLHPIASPLEPKLKKVISTLANLSTT